MFEQDYIMREIAMLARMLGKTIFHKEVETIELVDENGYTTGDGLLYFRLSTLVKQGEISKAEDLLFEEVQANPSHQLLLVACQFYDDLNNLNDAELAAGWFSKEEIVQGLADIKKMYRAIAQDQD